MSYLNASINEPDFSKIAFGRLLGGLLLLLLFQFAGFAQAGGITVSDDEKTLIVEDAKDSEILAFGKNVIVKQHAKGVFAFGGDIVIEGRVDEDVAVIGGSITQKEGAFIGGDVIVWGGAYQPEKPKPLRNPEKQTVIIGVFEEEFREFAQNPSQIFSTELTWTFLLWRILSVLFWFGISFAFTTISPGGISRAVARFQLSTLKVMAIGMSGLILTTIGVILSAQFLPGYIGGIIGLMGLLLLIFAYVFGRVTLQVSLGKLLQKYLVPESKHSETLAILLGVVGWTIILSIPYLWTLAVVVLFAASVGLVFTARQKNVWANS
ncbi:MAG: hypothetical protein JSS81_02145 [Acidobacteria bacterium]|nr:hypothetical protein [Acidobacteriota bacterium]